jgi:N-hydroxyarylamine O-acetyltransferase
MAITLNSPIDVAAYLEWIGFGGTPRVDLATLTELQQLHMTAVPFENLDIALGEGVGLNADATIEKIVKDGRGGWCFEVNGAFAALLEALGFEVILLGAAVLLDGPNRVIEHLALEVHADQPYLVDVGFGECFTRPLKLNTAGRQDGGNGVYEFIASPEGTTLALLDESDGEATAVPVAQYRFKRVAHTLDDFAAVSASMQVDAEKNWHKRPFATRLLDRGPDRVTLTSKRLKTIRDGTTTETPVAISAWPATLHDWFGIRLGAAEEQVLSQKARSAQP